MATLTMTVNAMPVVPAISGAGSICAGTTATLSDATTGGSWTSATTGVATINASGMVTGVSAGTAVISYTVTGSGCSATVTTTETVNAAPVVAAITGTTSICLGTATTLSDGTGGGTWTSGTTTVATINGSGMVTSVAAGATTIVYSVTAAGCTGTASTTVTVNAPPVVSAITGTTDVCAGSMTTLSDGSTGGSWTSANPSVATIDGSGNVTGVSAGTATISYTAGAAGCSTTVTATETVHALPTVAAIGGTTTACLGSVTTLTDGTPGGSWTSSNTSVATIGTTGEVTTLSLGTTEISYTVTGAFGCSSAVGAMFTVNTFSAGTLSPMGTVTMCHGNPVALSVTGGSGTAYQWYKDGSPLSGATASVYEATAAGVYSVVVSSGSCSGTLSSVTITPAPIPVIVHGMGTILYTSSFSSYQWFKNGVAITGATTSVYNETGAGNYIVVVHDASGCSDTSAAYTVSGGGGGGSTGVVTASGNGMDIKLYPNPATSVIMIDAPVKVNVSVLAADGKLIIRENDATSINVSGLANGMYMIMVYDQDNVLLKADKFIKIE